MKVVFLQDVSNVARAGDMKDVADGYARNYLIPHRLAAQANPRMMQEIEAQIRARARLAAQTEAEMKELAVMIDGKEITIKAKVGTNEKLYGSVTPGEIVDEIEKSLGAVVDKRKVELENPIRELGSHEVPVRLMKDIVPKITVTVVSEEA